MKKVYFKFHKVHFTPANSALLLTKSALIILIELCVGEIKGKSVL